MWRIQLRKNLNLLLDILYLVLSTLKVNNLNGDRLLCALIETEEGEGLMNERGIGKNHLTLCRPLRKSLSL